MPNFQIFEKMFNYLQINKLNSKVRCIAIERKR